MILWICGSVSGLSLAATVTAATGDLSTEAAIILAVLASILWLVAAVLWYFAQ